jgi:alanyl-tRNA synthetase
MIRCSHGPEIGSMTIRLYYDTPYQQVFDAVVTQVEAPGERLLVRLDRTCFYPTSGGQPFDTGRLGLHRVIDVIDDQDGAGIVHVVDSADSRGMTAGTGVTGTIDWPRRFDHMQQHTGQHLLSAALDRLHHAATVGFHLGAETSTIDLSLELDRGAIASAEDQANQIVWEDRAIIIRYAGAAEASGLPLRKESERSGTLRLIEINDFDLSACGGTHVARTGAVGVITILGWERFKGGTRLEFACGGRALARFRAMRETLAATMAALSVGQAEVPVTLDRWQAELREQRKIQAALRSELAVVHADRLSLDAEVIRGARVILSAVEGDADALKRLASHLTSRPAHIAVLVSTSRPSLAVVARSSDLEMSARDLLASLIASFGGRGGGKRDLAQAGGLDAEPAAILARARESLSAG